jgi:hypothetical protein
VRPLLVGEDNPYGSDPRFALYPRPTGSAGGRLCYRILKLTEKEYLRDFDRVNLCAGKWSMREARRSAAQLLADRGDLQSYALFGSKVCTAFNLDFKPFTIVWKHDGLAAIVILPHPSGRNRLWNEIGAFARARELLRWGGILPKESE